MGRFVRTLGYWLVGLFVITPVVLVLGAIGTILSIPVFLRWTPWKLARRPVIFLLVIFFQLVRNILAWIQTCAYGRVFFGESSSYDHHPQPWLLPYGLRVRYRFLLTAQRYFGMLRFQGWENKLRAEALEYCRKNPPRTEQVHMEIPRVKAGEISAAEFYQKYIKNPHPVIITGLKSDSQAVKNWTPEYFRKYSEDVAPLQTDNEDDLYAKTSKFGDYLDYIKANMNVPLAERPMLYLANFANLANKHPELIEELGARKMSEWMPGAMKTDMVGIHLFIGLSGTHTPFHCANTPNWFFQVQGRKLWTFVHPEHMMMMYPVVTSDVFYGGCMMQFPEPPSAVMGEDFPLWQYCPRYETVLEPGDVLFNPSWWWHRIMNESSPTIGCASRWIILPSTPTNTLFDFFHQWSSYFFCNAMHLIGKRAFRQPALTDETTLTVAQRRARVELLKAMHYQKRPTLQRAAQEAGRSTTPSSAEPAADPAQPAKEKVGPSA